MVDAEDLKSFVRKGVPVRVRQGARSQNYERKASEDEPNSAYNYSNQGNERGNDASPRERAIADLASAAARLAAAGDLAGARALHAALGALLEASAPVPVGAGDGVVVDLAGELSRRAKRER